jgi:tripartite-type tricarboxylate transporter receptor subunit TctC
MIMVSRCVAYAIIAACGLASGLITSSSARAQTANDKSVADFYRGNTVYMTIGSAPGGSFDLYGRIVGRYMAKYLPGNPTVVPQNLPGAGGYVAANRIAVTAPQDGTYIAGIPPGAIMNPIIGDPAKSSKPLKLNYIGNAAPNIEACFLRTDAPAKNFDEVFEKEIILGVTGTTAGSGYGYALLLRNILGLKLKIVAGYVSTTEIVLAMDRGEVQSLCNISYLNILATKPEWFAKDSVRALAYQGSKILTEKEMAGARPVASYAKTDEQRQILSLYDRQGDFGRPYVAGPQVPPDRIKALRDAFTAAMNDPELIKEVQGRGLEVSPMTGEELQKLVDEIYATPPELIKKMHTALGYFQ